MMSHDTDTAAPAPLFQFALGQRVREGADGIPGRIVGRVYEERSILGPVVWYRVLRAGVTQSVYEPDLLPVEGEA